MDTCITVWHWPNHPRWYDEGLKQTLGRVREAGFTHINWNPDAGSSYWYAQAEIAFIARTVAEAGLTMHSVHASNGRNPVSEIGFGLGRHPHALETRKDILSRHEWQRRSGVELLINRIDLAAATGSPDIVLHVDVTDDVFKSEDSQAAFFGSLFASLDELQPYCLDRGVRIAVETLTGASAITYLRLYERLFARYPGSFIGICLDVGHWSLCEPGGLSVLERFGERLIATHIHDNRGTADDHLLPFDGRIDWSMVTRAIAGTPVRMPLNLETPYDRYSLAEPAFYRRAHEVAQRLEEMVARARATP